MDDHTQHEIVHGLYAGNREVWLRFYEAYAERVWRNTARLMGNDLGAVADVVQETFLAAARSARGFDPKRGSLWMWLWGIARNQVALYYRQQIASDRLEQARGWWMSRNGNKNEWLAGDRQTPLEILASRELANLVRAALVELPADYQILLTSRYLDGMSAEQMATEANSTGNAVRSKLARARQAFRRAFVRVAGSPEVCEGVNDAFAEK